MKVELIGTIMEVGGYPPIARIQRIASGEFYGFDMELPLTAGQAKEFALKLYRRVSVVMTVEELTHEQL